MINSSSNCNLDDDSVIQSTEIKTNYPLDKFPLLDHENYMKEAQKEV